MLRLTAGLAAALLLLPSAGPTLEINGQTNFVAVPTKAKLTNFRWYAFDCCAVFYLTVHLPEGANADLKHLNLEQIRGFNRRFITVPFPSMLSSAHRGKRAGPYLSLQSSAKVLAQSMCSSTLQLPLEKPSRLPSKREPTHLQTHTPSRSLPRQPVLIR